MLWDLVILALSRSGNKSNKSALCALVLKTLKNLKTVVESVFMNKLKHTHRKESFSGSIDKLPFVFSCLSTTNGESPFPYENHQQFY